MPFVSTAEVTNASRIGAPFVPDVVVVRFTPEATQNNRQDAINAISGAVVGGVPFEDGVEGAYYVKIPEDTTNQRIFAAIDTLRSFAVVEDAMPDLIVTDAPAYRLPNDGTGMQSADWHLDPASAFGHRDRRTWALEAINAPYAWGCNTGRTATRVAALDFFLRREGGIVGNVVDTNGLNPATFRHGTEVASIIGAQGNDGSGTIGVAWHVGLLLYGAEARDSTGAVAMYGGGVRTDVVTVTAKIVRAMSRGARVINMSFANNTPQSNNTHTPQWDSVRAMTGRMMANAITRSPRTRPLIVMAAGNPGNGTSTYWSQFTAVAQYLPNQTIIVAGATSTAGQLDFTSATGSDISVAAPSDSVTVDDGTGAQRMSGTSAAAPLVSGTAALLFSFDSTLLAARVKQLIDSGAVAGGRVAAGGGQSYPFLDAYASLQLAAKRNNGPLCGNRIWADGDAIIVQRETAGGGRLDSIATGLDTPVEWISAVHGGHQVFFHANNATGERVFSQANGWQSGASPDNDWNAVPAARNTGLFLWSGSSHGGDSLVFMTRYLASPYDPTMFIDVMVPDTISWDQTARYTFTGVPTDTTSPVVGAFAPKGGRIFVTVPTTTGTTLYRFSTQNFAPTTVQTFSGRRVYGLSMNELETEYVVTSGDLTQSGSTYLIGGDCKVEYYDTSFNLLRSVSASGSCIYDLYMSTHGGVGSHASRQNVRRGPPR